MKRSRIRKGAFLDRGTIKFPLTNRQGILYGWLTIDSFTRWMELKESERPTPAATVIGLKRKSL